MTDSVGLKAIIYDQCQEPLPCAKVVVTLTHYDIDVDDQQYIIPQKQTLYTDELGEVLFTVWRNSEGARASQYKLEAFEHNNRRPVLNVKFTVPETALEGDNILDYAQVEPFPPRGDFELLLLQTQEARDEALAAADAAAQSAIDAQAVLEVVWVKRRTILDTPATVNEAGWYLVRGSGTITLATPIGQTNGMVYDFLMSINSKPTITTSTNGILTKKGLKTSILLDKDETELVINNNVYEEYKH